MHVYIYNVCMHMYIYLYIRIHTYMYSINCPVTGIDGGTPVSTLLDKSCQGVAGTWAELGGKNPEKSPFVMGLYIYVYIYI